MEKATTEHERALKEAVAKAEEWERKYSTLKSEVALKLQLKEAEVKNSMMSVAWSAHTSALTMRFGGLSGGIMGSVGLGLGPLHPGPMVPPPLAFQATPLAALGFPVPFLSL